MLSSESVPMVTLIINQDQYHLCRIDEAVVMCQVQDFTDLTDEHVYSARIVTQHDLGLWDRSA
jgi:hypothetical protein